MKLNSTNSTNLMKRTLKNWIELSKWGYILNFQGKVVAFQNKKKIGQSWFKLLDDLKVRYSRIDIALDDYKGLLDFDVMEEKIKKGEVISLSRTRNIDSSLDFSKAEKLDNKGQSKGKTLYFGNRQSLMMIRFYDKKREQEAKKNRMQV